MSQLGTLMYLRKSLEWMGLNYAAIHTFLNILKSFQKVNMKVDIVK